MVGISTDPQFGQMLVIASEGILVELIRDSFTLLLPTSDENIGHANRSLNCFQLLDGFPGKPKADTIRLVFSFAETPCHSLVEMDIKLLLVTREKCIAADVMICEAGAKY